MSVTTYIAQFDSTQTTHILVALGEEDEDVGGGEGGGEGEAFEELQTKRSSSAVKKRILSSAL